MKKANFARVMEQVKFHSNILFKGLVRTVYGALVAWLIVIAIYGFIIIQSESGYLAVFDFIASCATLSVALRNMYIMGGKKRGGRK